MSKRGLNLLIALGVFLTALFLSIRMLPDRGLTWDEPNSFFAGVRQIDSWQKAIVQVCRQGGWTDAFSRELTARYFPPPTRETQLYDFFNNHPPVPRFAGYVTWRCFRDQSGDISSMRLAAALTYALLVAVVFLIGALQSRAVGLTAAFFTLTQPQLFAFSNFLTTDIFLAFFWMLIGYLFLRGLISTSPGRWYLAAWAAFGLAVNVKFTALMIPLPLLIYLWFKRREQLKICLALSPVSAAIAYVSNPTWWHHPFSTFLHHHVLLSLTRTSYYRPTSFYWGELYLNAPWHYPLVITFVTVPVVILGFVLVALLSLTGPRPRSSLTWFGLINVLSLFVIASLPGAPRYDLVRLFLPVLPLLSLIAAIAAVELLSRLYYSLIRFRPVSFAPIILIILCALIAFQQIRESVVYKDFPLSYYNELIGGLPGAYARGMEATYWMEVITPRLITELNSLVTPGALLSSYPYCPDVLEYYQAGRLLRRDIRIVSLSQKPQYVLVLNRRSNLSREIYLRLRAQGYRPLKEVDFMDVPLLAVLYHPTAR